MKSDSLQANARAIMLNVHDIYMKEMEQDESRSLVRLRMSVLLYR